MPQTITDIALVKGEPTEENPLGLALFLFADLGAVPDDAEGALGNTTGGLTLNLGQHRFHLPQEKTDIAQALAPFQGDLCPVVEIVDGKARRGWYAACWMD